MFITKSYGTIVQWLKVMFAFTPSFASHVSHNHQFAGCDDLGPVGVSEILQKRCSLSFQTFQDDQAWPHYLGNHVATADLICFLVNNLPHTLNKTGKSGHLVAKYAKEN